MQIETSILYWIRKWAAYNIKYKTKNRGSNPDQKVPRNKTDPDLLIAQIKN